MSRTAEVSCVLSEVFTCHGRSMGASVRSAISGREGRAPGCCGSRPWRGSTHFDCHGCTGSSSLSPARNAAGQAPRITQRSASSASRSRATTGRCSGPKARWSAARNPVRLRQHGCSGWPSTTLCSCSSRGPLGERVDRSRGPDTGQRQSRDAVGQFRLQDRGAGPAEVAEELGGMLVGAAVQHDGRTGGVKATPARQRDHVSAVVDDLGQRVDGQATPQAGEHRGASRGQRRRVGRAQLGTEVEQLGGELGLDGRAERWGRDHVPAPMPVARD